MSSRVRRLSCAFEASFHLMSTEAGRRHSMSVFPSTTSTLLGSESSESPESGVVSESNVDPVDLEQLAERQEESLVPLKEDLAEWLAKLFDIDISGETFMSALDNGVYVCKLAQLVHDKAVQWRQENKTNEVIPSRAPRCRDSAAAGSWFARDNTANFLSWCREYQINDDILFETEGLVLHRQTRSVVLCLLEIARIGARFGLDPLPSLITLEREIDREEALGVSPENWFPTLDDSVFDESVDSVDEAIADVTDVTDTPSSDDVDIASDIASDLDSGHDVVSDAGFGDAKDTSGYCDVSDTSCYGDVKDTSPVEHNAPVAIVKPILQETTHIYNNSITDSTKTPVKTPLRRLPNSPLNDEVMKMIRTCKCKPNCYEVQRLAEGKYIIGGRTVFIRLLKGRHVMVRVGGGWDTLEHYLKKHDPCRGFRVVDGQCRRISSSRLDECRPPRLELDTPIRRPHSGNPGFLVFTSRYKPSK